MDSSEAGAIAQIAATRLVAISVSFSLMPMRQYRDFVLGVSSVLAGFLVLSVALWGMGAEPSGFFGEVYKLVIYIMMAGLAALAAITFMIQLAEINLARLRREEAAVREAAEIDREVAERSALPWFRRRKWIAGRADGARSGG